MQFADQHGMTVLPALVDCTRKALAEVEQSKVPFPTTDITDPANRDFDLEEFNRLLHSLSRVQSYLGLLQGIYNSQGNNLQPRPIVGYTMWLNVEANVDLLESIVAVLLRYIHPLVIF